MIDTPIGRLRVIAWLEGLSFVILLFVAMPMKYIWGIPSPVRFVGLIHGLLFIIFGFTLAHVSATQTWPFKFIFRAALASVIPFGTFMFDKKLKALEPQL